MEQRITIIRTRRSPYWEINEELQWVGNCLGLFSERDRDKSCFRLFFNLLHDAKEGGCLSSEELAQRTGLSRGTVVHHLHRLISAGLVVEEREKYFLRERNIEGLMQEVQRDMELFFQEMQKAAKEIDKKLVR